MERICRSVVGMELEAKRNWAAILLISAVLASTTGFFVYMSLIGNDYLSPGYISRLMYASSIMMAFSAAGGIMGVIGFILLLDWFKSK